MWWIIEAFVWLSNSAAAAAVLLVRMIYLVDLNQKHSSPDLTDDMRQTDLTKQATPEAKSRDDMISLGISLSFNRNKNDENQCHPCSDEISPSGAPCCWNVVQWLFAPSSDISWRHCEYPESVYFGWEQLNSREYFTHVSAFVCIRLACCKGRQANQARHSLASTDCNHFGQFTS